MDWINHETEGPAAAVVRKVYRKEIMVARAVGFIGGLVVMAMLNIGDVHLCMGECDSAGFAITDIWKESRQ